MHASPTHSAPAAPRGRVLLLALVLFAIIGTVEWRWYVEGHEAIYLMGPHRLSDPAFLANDFTWGTLPPTTFIYNHLLAPMWGTIGDFGIAVVGRLVFWALMAWAIAEISYSLAIPAWSTIAGITFWMLTGQRVFLCGAPIEGFQPKALAYPFLFFALADFLRGRLPRAGVLCGIATALHVVVGGWGFLGMLGALILARTPLRALAGFALPAVPFLGGTVIALSALAHGTPAEIAEMDRIYVMFAAPHCCDPAFFGIGAMAVFAAVLFLVSFVLLHQWQRAGSGRLAGYFVVCLVAFFLLGLVARRIELFGFLKLYPFQLANALPAMLLAMVLPVWLAGLRSARWPARMATAGGLALAVVAWRYWDVPLVAPEIPNRLFDWKQVPDRAFHFGDRPAPMELYEWIRRETPRDAVFVTPFMQEFWVCAERAQVVSLRHPPFDRRLIEWMRRLEAINDGQPLHGAGFEESADSLSAHQARLSPQNLVALRDSCAATHYLVARPRPDLKPALIHVSGRWHVYDLSRLEVNATAGSAERQVEGVPVVNPEQQ